MKSIAVLNQKGGSGKTHLSVMLALSLSNKDRVCVVDCDPQGGLTSFCNVSGPGMFELLTMQKFEPLQITWGKFNFDVIPADHRLDNIYATLQPFAIEKAFKDFDYDYLIFDCPPTVQGITRATALFADKIIIPADISRATIGPTLYTLDALKDIKKTGKVYLLGKDPGEKTGFTADLTREMMKALKNHLGGFITKSVSIQKAVSGETMPGDKTLEIYRGMI